MIEIIDKTRVLEAYRNAPDFVRDAFDSEETTKIVMDMQKRLQLHIDMAGTLGKEIGYLLLGITDPTEFTSRLKTTGFSDQVVATIAKELNEKIFAPLRKEEERPRPQPQPTKPPVVPQAPAVVPSAARPATPLPPHVAPLPPRFLTSEATMKIQVESRNRELPPKVVMPSAPSRPTGTLGDIVRSVIAAPVSPKSNTLLEDHEELHIELPEVRPSPAIPKVEPQIPVLARQPMSGAIPPNLPGMMPPAPVRPAAPIAPVTPKAEAPKPALAAPIKSYAGDPYREPIDEA